MAYCSPLEVLREEVDTLANVDAFGKAVPTARFMGGREYAAICGVDVVQTQPSVGDLEAVLESGALAVPSFADQGGPFRSHAGLCADDGLLPDDARSARRYHSRRPPRIERRVRISTRGASGTPTGISSSR